MDMKKVAEKVKGKGKIDRSSVCPKQLKKGTAVENSEHPGMDGELIAFQHLKEIPDYYDRLEAMEEGYKAEKKENGEENNNDEEEEN